MSYALLFAQQLYRSGAAHHMRVAVPFQTRRSPTAGRLCSSSALSSHRITIDKRWFQINSKTGASIRVVRPFQSTEDDLLGQAFR